MQCFHTWQPNHVVAQIEPLLPLVVETLATESKILAVLPFMNIQGSGYTYNVEKTLSDTQFRAVGEAITPGHAEC